MSRTPPSPAAQGRAAAALETSFFSYRRDRPLVFAHRGGCALGPENTLAAFDAGLAAGANGLELDVHLSADGVAVVHHDARLDRTTDSSGPVAARTAAELSRVNAGCRFVRDPAAPSGGAAEDPALVGVPTLAVVLRRYPAIPIIIEMKEDSETMARAVLQDVEAAGAESRVCAAGYGRRSLDTCRRLAPDIATSAAHAEVRWALWRSWVRWPVRRTAYGGYQVPEYAGTIRVVSPGFVKHAHEAGLQVQVWTVDEEEDMRRLLAWGVDALITNRPDLARRVVDDVVGRR